MLSYAVAVTTAFLTVMLATPLLIRSAWKHDLLDRDDNKPGRPFVAALGGFALFGGIAAGVLFAVLYQIFLINTTANLTILLGGLACISILALIGVFDDVFKLSRVIKSILPIAGAFPLVAVNAGKSLLNLPLFGLVDFGALYTFLLVPLGVTGAANAVNMSAGYNGLEAGIGVVASFFLIVIGLQLNAPAAGLVILFACLGACLAFLFFNWFPAKTFPADIGTLSIGAALASGVIISGLEKYGVVLFLPAFYELFVTIYYSFKGVQRRRACHNPVILPGGRLVPPRGSERFTLFYFILSKKQLTEQSLVLTTLGLYAACGVLALLMFYF